MRRRLAYAVIILLIVPLRCREQSEVDRLRAELRDDASDINRRAAIVQDLQAKVWRMEHGSKWDWKQAEYDALVGEYYGQRSTLLGIMARYDRNLSRLRTLDPSVKIATYTVYNLDKNLAAPGATRRLEIRPSGPTPEAPFSIGPTAVFWPGEFVLQMFGVGQQSSGGVVAATLLITLGVWLGIISIPLLLLRRLRTKVSEARMWSEYRRTGKLPRA